MEKIWLKSYPRGVPAEINPDAYHSLVDMFDQSCKLYHHQPAYYCMGKTLTYGQIDDYSRSFAAYLQNGIHLKKGDRFAIMLPNVLQYPIAMFGAMRAGLVIVNVNPLYTAEELIYQMEDSGAETIVTVTNFAITVQKAWSRVPRLKNVIISHLGDLLQPFKGKMVDFVMKYIYKKIPPFHLPKSISFKEVLAKGEGLPYTKVAFHNEDPAYLQYTGGTTGVSKGAVLTHRNLVANIQQASAWFNNILSHQEIIITALPLYHIFSLLGNCLFFTKQGGLNVLITNPRDIVGMIKTMKKFKFTAITGVNTLFNALLRNPAFKKLDFSHLHFSLGGGMAIQEVVAKKWQEVTGVPLLEAYGLTETSPCITINPPDMKEFNGCIGLPVSSTDVCFFDDDGKEVPLGQAGELAVKGPQVMAAYWNNPAETARVFTPQGWLLTGDIAMMDDRGFIRLLERKKDMILVSGFNVYPNEIEDILAKMAGVREVAVIAVPDEYSGEIPKAFIVRDDPALTAEHVTHYAREHLTPYKVPKYVAFVTELPKSNVGKILRRALRGESGT